MKIYRRFDMGTIANGGMGGMNEMDSKLREALRLLDIEHDEQAFLFIFRPVWNFPASHFAMYAIVWDVGYDARYSLENV